MNFPDSNETDVLVYDENQQHTFNTTSVVINETPSYDDDNIQDQISCSSTTTSTTPSIIPSSTSSTSSSIPIQSTEVPTLTGHIDTLYPFHSLVEKNKLEEIQLLLQSLPAPYHSSFSNNYNHIQQSIYPHVHNILQQHHPHLHVDFINAKQQLLDIIHQQCTLNPNGYLPCEQFLIGKYCDETTCNRSHHELYSDHFNKYCIAYIAYYQQFRALTILQSITALPADDFIQHQSDFQYYQSLLTPTLRTLYDQSEESIIEPVVDTLLQPQQIQDVSMEREVIHQQQIQSIQPPDGLNHEQPVEIQIQNIDQESIKSPAPLLLPQSNDFNNITQDKSNKLSKAEAKLAKERNKEFVTSLLLSIVSQSRSMPSLAQYFPLPPLDHPAILALPVGHDIDQQVQQSQNVQHHSKIALQLQSYFAMLFPSKTQSQICGDFLLNNCHDTDCTSIHGHQSKFVEVAIAFVELEQVRRATKILLSISQTNQIIQFIDDVTKYSVVSSRPSSLTDSKLVQCAMNHPALTTTSNQSSMNKQQPTTTSQPLPDDNQTTSIEKTKAEKAKAKKAAKKEKKVLKQAEAKELLAKLKTNNKPQPKVNVVETNDVTVLVPATKPTKPEPNDSAPAPKLIVPSPTVFVPTQKSTKKSAPNVPKSQPTESKVTKNVYSIPITSLSTTQAFIDSILTSSPTIELPPQNYPDHLHKPNPINSNLISKFVAELLECYTSHSDKFKKIVLKSKDNGEPICKGYLINQCINSDEFQCCYNHNLECYQIFSRLSAALQQYQLHKRALRIICRINQSPPNIRTQYQEDLQKYTTLIGVPLVFGCDPTTVEYKSSLERFQCTGELVNCFESLDDYAEYYTAALNDEMKADRFLTEKEVIGVEIIWEQAVFASGDPKIIATVKFTSEQRGHLALSTAQSVAFLHPDVPSTIPSAPIKDDATTFAANQQMDSLIQGSVQFISHRDESIQFVLSGHSAGKFAPIIKSLPRDGWSIAAIFDELSYKDQLKLLKNISFDSEQLVGLFLGTQRNSITHTAPESCVTTITPDWRSNSTLFPAEFLPTQITNAPTLRPLNDSQRRAIELALTNPVLSVQGPPGTGKSTTLSNLVYHLIQSRQLQQRGILQQFYHEQIVATEDIELDDLLSMMMKRADTMNNGSISKNNKKKNHDEIDSVVKSQPPQKLHPILVAAPSNIAADHLAELLMRIPNIDVLRISSKRHRLTNFAKDNDHVENAALHRRVEAWINENPESELALLHQKFFGGLNSREKATLSAKLDDIMNTDLPQHRKHLKDDGDSSEMAIFFAELDRQGVKTRKINGTREQKQNDFNQWKYLFYQLQFSIISGADVVCTTFALCANRDLFSQKLKFEHVILDEVSQASEMSLLLPLSHFPKHLVLFGDQQQLGPVVKQRGIYRDILLRSMFDRLFETKSCQTTMLTTQYRMHPTIATFSSNQFYDGLVKSGVTAQERSKFRDSFPWPQPDHPLCFISTNNLSQQQFEGFSSYNLVDIDIMVQLLIRFILQGVDLTEIGLVLPYSAQVRYLRKALYDEKNGFVHAVYNQYFQTNQSTYSYYFQSPSQPYAHGISKRNLHHQRNQYEFDQPQLDDAIHLIEEMLQIDTVDAFQGREKPLMIFNSVRTASKQNSNFKSGSFITDNRLNVAITRAQYGFIVVGDDKFFDDNHGTLSEFKSSFQTLNRLILPHQHKKLFFDFDRLVQKQIAKKKQLMYEQRQKRIQEAELRKQKSIDNRPVILSSNAAPFFPSLPPPE